MGKVIKLWLPVVVWAGLIFVLSGIPDLKTGLEYDFILRKFAHVLEYFILALLLYRALSGSFNSGLGLLVALTGLLTLLYAATDELHQAFVPGRVCSGKDLLIDSAGIVLFWLAVKSGKINLKPQKSE